MTILKKIGIYNLYLVVGQDKYFDGQMVSEKWI